MMNGLDLLPTKKRVKNTLINYYNIIDQIISDMFYKLYTTTLDILFNEISTLNYLQIAFIFGVQTL